MFPLVTTSLHVLTPNGLMVSVDVDSTSTMASIKDEVLDVACGGPNFGLMQQDRSLYVLICVNPNTGRQEEIFDENQKVARISPFFGILRLTEKKIDESTRQFSALINRIIGIGLHVFDALKNPEVNDCRWKLRLISDEERDTRLDYDFIKSLLYEFPVRISETVPVYVEKILMGTGLELEIRFDDSKKFNILKVAKTCEPMEIIERALKSDSRLYESKPKPQDFILRVNGRHEYLWGKHAILLFRYIQDMIVERRTPTLAVVLIAALKENLAKSGPEDKRASYPIRRRTSSTVSQINQNWFNETNKKLKIFVNHIKNVWEVGSEESTYCLKIGLFHGLDSLMLPLETSYVSKSEDSFLWNEKLTFPIAIMNVPKSSKICMSLFEKNGAKVCCIAWANTPFYDFKGVIKHGATNLPIIFHANQDSKDAQFFPEGACRPYLFDEDVPCLMITFQKHDDEESTRLSLMSHSEHQREHSTSPKRRSSKTHMSQLGEISLKTSADAMSQQDKELFRLLRSNCCDSLPHTLPHVLRSVKWTDRDDVQSVMSLIKEWSLISPQLAISLLDAPYPDAEIRSFAVRCLQQLSDDDLLLYMIQMVQALRYEMYFLNPLSEFLLRRSLRNRLVGHRLFWMLRAQMEDNSVSIPFGLILEAYCWGDEDHVRVIAREIEAHERLKSLTEQMARENWRRREVGSDQYISYFRQVLSQDYYRECLKESRLTLDPRIKLSNLVLEKCKLMDSKMQPLWLVFTNGDFGAEDFCLIFKNGDDLRQDMLTLQMLRIMDNLWKMEGINFKMCIYGCVATGPKTGFIEVVRNASTIANIQKEKGLRGTMAFKKGCIYSWLKGRSADDQHLQQMIQDFTLSCAAYSVASFVLGIADRHSDNIMIKSTGQLFHIDFGHILGRFKEKFGIRRERVPFVLTHDFVYVMTRGKKTSPQFELFKQYCENAYLIIRKNGHFIINLFSLMLSSGIPEISSVRDLDYLKDTLVLELSDPDALTFFRAKFDEALNNSWKTSLNWMAHNISKDNK